MRTFYLLPIAGLIACHHGTSEVPAEEIDPLSSNIETVARQSDVLTNAEMRASDANDIYSAIQKLRPSFFSRSVTRSKNDQNVSVLSVYLDDNRIGDVGKLRGMPIEAVKQVQYLSPTQAATRFTDGHVGAVIHLTTR